MKKYATISLFVFWAAVTAVVAAGLISYGGGSQSVIGIGSNTPQVSQLDNVGNITRISPGANTLTLSSAELVKHKSAQSCWLLISGKVYDVTSFLPNHPGEAKTILPTCGTDATIAYASRGGTGSHSSSAHALLANYYIGDLNQNVVTSSTPSTNSGQANPTTPTIANPNPILPVSGREDDEFDD